MRLCFVALLHCCKPLKTLKLLYPLERLNFLNPSIPFQIRSNQVFHFLAQRLGFEHFDAVAMREELT